MITSDLVTKNLLFGVAITVRTLHNPEPTFDGAVFSMSGIDQTKRFAKYHIRNSEN